MIYLGTWSSVNPTPGSRGWFGFIIHCVWWIRAFHFSTQKEPRTPETTFLLLLFKQPLCTENLRRRPDHNTIICRRSASKSRKWHFFYLSNTFYNNKKRIHKMLKGDQSGNKYLWTAQYGVHFVLYIPPFSVECSWKYMKKVRLRQIRRSTWQDTKGK